MLREEELPLAQLIGRTRELGEIDRLLSDVRLVTLTGLGGIGKSSIASELVRLRSARGARAVVAPMEVAGATDAVARIADAMAIPDSPGIAREEAVLEALVAQPTLLVLDGLPPDCDIGVVRSLLIRSERTEVLITSRQAVRIAGEKEYPIQPLGLPADASLVALRAAPGTQLFLREAERVGTSVADADAQAVWDICARTGGIPLALELAATSTRVMSPAALARKLRAHGGRTRQAAHIRIIEEAADMLRDELALQAAGLAIVPTTFGFGTAEVLLDDPEEVLQALLHLGLVRRIASSEPRFEILPPVRDVLLERLDRAGETSRAFTRLSAWALGFATAESDRLWRGNDTSALDRIRDELDAMRAALDWCTTYNRQEGAEILSALSRYWCRMAPREGLHRSRELLELGGIDADQRARLLDMQALTSLSLLGTAEATAVASRLLSLAGESGNAWAEMRARFTIGCAMADADDSERSITELTRAAAIAEALGDDEETVRILSNLAISNADAGRVETAVGQYRSAIQSARRTGDSFALAMCLMNLAPQLMLSDELSAAASAIEEAERLLAPFGDSAFGAFAAGTRAAISARQGDLAGAETSLRRAAGLVESLGANEDLALLLENAAFVNLAARRPREAARLLGAAQRVRAEDGRGALAIQAAIRAAQKDLGARAFEIAYTAGGDGDPWDLLRDPLFEQAALGDRVQGSYGRLSPREQEVLKLVADGLTDAHIAAELGISPKTVSVHVFNLKVKLGIDTRIELALAGRRLLPD